MRLMSRVQTAEGTIIELRGYKKRNYHNSNKQKIKKHTIGKHYIATAIKTKKTLKIKLQNKS